MSASAAWLFAIQIIKARQLRRLKFLSRSGMVWRCSMLQMLCTPGHYFAGVLILHMNQLPGCFPSRSDRLKFLGRSGGVRIGSAARLLPVQIIKACQLRQAEIPGKVLRGVALQHAGIMIVAHGIKIPYCAKVAEAEVPAHAQIAAAARPEGT